MAGESLKCAKGNKKCTLYCSETSCKIAVQEVFLEVLLMVLRRFTKLKKHNTNL